MDYNYECSWGRLEHDQALATDAQDGIQQRMHWAPTPRLAARLPDGFGLPFVVRRSPDGCHQVLPATFPSLDAFLSAAGLLGQIHLEDLGVLNDEHAETCKIQRLRFCQRRQVREWPARMFNHTSDLQIPNSVRNSAADTVTLPEEITEKYDFKTATQFVQFGRDAVKEHGDSNATPAECIRLGLKLAAIAAPIDVTELSIEQTAALVRIGLFIDDPETRVEYGQMSPFESLTCARERFGKFFFDRRNDSREKFNLFLEEPYLLVRRASELKKGGGPIPREVVRRDHLLLLFEACKWVSDCVHAALRPIRQCLSDVLTDAELERFDFMYRRCGALGGLAPIVIHDRLTLMGIDPIGGPDSDRSPGMILKLFQFHAEMIEKRRQADRRYKSDDAAGVRVKGSNALQKFMAEMNDSPDPLEAVDACTKTGQSQDRPEPSSTSLTTTLSDASRVAVVFEFECRCPDEDAWQLIAHPATCNDDNSELEISCVNCELSERLPITEELKVQLREAASRMAEEDW